MSTDSHLGGFAVRTLSDRHERLLNHAEHVLIGLSPFNGYYKPRLIRDLVAWGHHHFARADVFVPGWEAAHTLTGAGVSPRDAVHRSRRAAKQLRNAAVDALRSCGADEPHLRVHTSTTLANRWAYTRLHDRVRTEYARDPVLRAACRETARDALRTYCTEPPSERQIDLAVSYPLAELPLFLDSPGIFATESSVVVYHREMKPFTPLILGRSPAVRPVAGQGFAVVTHISSATPGRSDG
ncbi:tRNA-dependent cyclodipeptide synthase [Streptomyces sp. XD-27]|uniref:tRNA-dependent cyclodipeptide synthase n=1 Tax=Streptomyces sp. XD-27 TaxID=3062779 RepID=UPI0026F44A73|nr:tRNA-dependent cyclodipeptide synthase [Streptomyces sp. XD-27]WKX70374.1 tRNA-dependent cyclodipeptide synthase [Streptomyces sp. XD-27]